ncbi:ExbD/TolR family protein [Aliiroseovarius sp.]|uniref:ExbD/TolR family protein n=1 Tax=Aliiroseovarius sp. TaxID=1872442 RepID=UPI003BAAC59A
MSGPSRLELPQRKPTYRFSLTPLADAMFQLLIFFMLSSSLTPYSLLTLQSAAAGEAAPAVEGAETTTDDAGADQPGDVALWTIGHEGLTVGGQAFGFDALESLAGALGSEAAPADVILLVEDTARVQDVTTVLEHLQTANVASVRVATGEGG